MSSRRTGARGFTLLEVTVVLLLVALMSTLLMDGLRFGARAYAQAARENERNWEVFVAQRFLRDALETVYPFDPERAANKAYGLEGTAERLSFSAALPRSAVPGALNRYEVYVATDAGYVRRHNLQMTWRPDRDGRPPAATVLMLQEVLVEDIERIELSYAGPSCGAGQIDWQEAWQGHRELPSLVRMRVFFPKGDLRQWPEMIVAPRVSNDAMSWVDRPPDATPACEKSG